MTAWSSNDQEKACPTASMEKRTCAAVGCVPMWSARGSASVPTICAETCLDTTPEYRARIFESRAGIQASQVRRIRAKQIGNHAGTRGALGWARLPGLSCARPCRTRDRSSMAYRGWQRPVTKLGPASRVREVTAVKMWIMRRDEVRV